MYVSDNPRPSTMTFTYDKTPWNIWEKRLPQGGGDKNLPFVLGADSSERTLVKDLHFIGPELSLLIKLTVTQRATQGRGQVRGGDRLVPNSCDTQLHLSLCSHQMIISSCGVEKKKIKEKKRSHSLKGSRPLILYLLKICSKWQSSLQSGSNICRNTLDFNDGYETANEQVKSSSVESGMNTLACADRWVLIVTSGKWDFT